MGLWCRGRGDSVGVGSLEESGSVRCPGCGQVVELPAAEEQGEQDAAAELTCPTCGSGFDRDGNLVHDPVIGP